jgi:hypothetical protein
MNERMKLMVYLFIWEGNRLMKWLNTAQKEGKMSGMLQFGELIGLKVLRQHDKFGWL